MTSFDKVCNRILLEYSSATRKLDVPYNGVSAPNRYNNPGGAYPAPKFEKFGLEGFGIIDGGHKIAKYPTLEDGIAANIYHLRGMPIVGRSVQEARDYWVNGNFNGGKRNPVYGLDPNEVVTQENLNDPTWLAKWMMGTAKAEGFQGTLSEDSLRQAFSKVGIDASTFKYDPNAAGTAGQYASTYSHDGSGEGQEGEQEQDPTGTSSIVTDLIKGGVTRDSAALAMNKLTTAARGFLDKHGGGGKLPF